MEHGVIVFIWCGVLAKKLQFAGAKIRRTLETTKRKQEKVAFSSLRPSIGKL